MTNRMRHPRWHRPLFWPVCAAVWVIGLGSLAVSLADEPAEVAGATLADWRVRISQLELNDPANARWVPGLIELTRRGDVPWVTRRQAALTLGRMGPTGADAVPVLVAILKNSDFNADEETALWSIKALGLFGPLARNAAPTLTQAYADVRASHLIRLSILDTLSQIGPAQASVIPFLTDVAESDRAPAGSPATVVDAPSEGLRRAAIETLGIIGSAAATAIPTLVRALEHENESLRREAATALGKMGPAADVAVLALAERLVFDASPAVQDQAAVALGEIGTADVGTILAQLADSDDRELRYRIAGIYGTWGPAAREWKPQIERLQQDADARVRLAAHAAWWKVTQDAGEIADRVIAEFTDEDRQVRRQAFVLFEQLGQAGCESTARLKSLQQHPRAEVRLLAEKALQGCGAPND